MSKTWKPGEPVPVDHINELEEKAESYDRYVAASTEIGEEPDAAKSKK